MQRMNHESSTISIWKYGRYIGIYCIEKCTNKSIKYLNINGLLLPTSDDLFLLYFCLLSVFVFLSLYSVEFFV